MTYYELVHTYFERSVALQWYWTIYVVVIGGVGAFSIFRQRPELTTTLIVTILYAGFAYKNLGAIEATAEERQAVRLAILDFPDRSGVDIKRVRDKLEATMPEYDIAGARHFHWACDGLLIAFLWIKEWYRKKAQRSDAHHIA
jgi:hypothetical protein